MEREKIVKEIGRPIFSKIGFAQLICIILCISSPFIWVWFGVGLAFKVSITGCMGILLCKFINVVCKGVIESVVDHEIKPKDKPIYESKFHKKLKARMEQAKKDSNQQIMNLYENFISNIDLENPEFEKRTKTHDWRNYVPDNWVKEWLDLSIRERTIIAVMAEMQADNEEWD